MMWSQSDVGDLFKIKGIVNTEKSDSEPTSGESWLIDPKRTDRKKLPQSPDINIIEAVLNHPDRR